MRRMILTSLVLVPVMAHAQTATSTEPQPSTSSAMVAELAQPAELAMSAAAKAAAPAASIAAMNTSTHAAVREFRCSLPSCRNPTFTGISARDHPAAG